MEYAIWENLAGDKVVLPENPRKFRKAIRSISDYELGLLIQTLYFYSKWLSNTEMVEAYGPHWRDHLTLLFLEEERRDKDPVVEENSIAARKEKVIKARTARLHPEIAWAL